MGTREVCRHPPATRRPPARCDRGAVVVLNRPGSAQKGAGYFRATGSTGWTLALQGSSIPWVPPSLSRPLASHRAPPRARVQQSLPASSTMLVSSNARRGPIYFDTTCVIHINQLSSPNVLCTTGRLPVARCMLERLWACAGQWT